MLHERVKTNAYAAYDPETHMIFSLMVIQHCPYAPSRPPLPTARMKRSAQSAPLPSVLTPSTLPSLVLCCTHDLHCATNNAASPCCGLSHAFFIYSVPLTRLLFQILHHEHNIFHIHSILRAK